MTAPHLPTSSNPIVHIPDHLNPANLPASEPVEATAPIAPAQDKPAQAESAPEAPEVDPNAVAVAMAPAEGQAYTFGGKTFHLTYLTVAGQNALDKLLKPWMAGGVGKSPAEMMESIADSLAPAAALILSEQDPEATEAWVAGLKGKAIRQELFDLVMAQVGLDEVGKFYAVLSYTAASLRRAAGVA